MIWRDPIVDDVRRIREEHAARFGYDLKRIVEDIRRQERESGDEYVRLPPRRVVPVQAAPTESEEDSELRQNQNE